jgi:Flp pilus assembly protein TadG
MGKPLSSIEHLRRLANRSDGVAAVEFAIIMPLFIMMAFGVLVFGIYFAGLIAVTNAASEGARASVAGLSAAERQTLATNAATSAFASYAPFLKQNYMTVVTQQNPANNSQFQVSVSYDFSQFGLSGFSSWVPLPVAKPTVTVSVADAGYF